MNFTVFLTLGDIVFLCILLALGFGWLISYLFGDRK